MNGRQQWSPLGRRPPFGFCIVVVVAVLAALVASSATAHPEKLPCRRDSKLDPDRNLLARSSCRTNVILVGSITVTTDAYLHYESKAGDTRETETEKHSCKYKVTWDADGTKHVTFLYMYDLDDLATKSVPGGTATRHHTISTFSVNSKGDFGTWVRSGREYLGYGPIDTSHYPILQRGKYMNIPLDADGLADFSAPSYSEETIVTTSADGDTTTVGPNVTHGHFGNCPLIAGQWRNEPKILKVVPTGLNGVWKHDPPVVEQTGNGWTRSSSIHWLVTYKLRAVRRAGK